MDSSLHATGATTLFDAEDVIRKRTGQKFGGAVYIQTCYSSSRTGRGKCASTCCAGYHTSDTGDIW